MPETAKQVYNGWTMKCVPCVDEFGQGTLDCDDSGATECVEGFFI